MTLSIDSLIFADVRIQGVTLNPVVGAYELRFGLLIVVSAASEGVNFRAVIDGARIGLRAGGGQPVELGFARADRQLEIITRSYQDRTTPTLSLPLQPEQLAAIEELRGEGDLYFDLEVTGTGSGKTGTVPVNDTLRCHVPRSEWIEKLRGANACDVLLLEVPLPFPGESDRWDPITEDLRRAESRYRDGDYHGCVSACRVTVEGLGAEIFGSMDWTEQFPAGFSSTVRRKMSKTDRERAILGALRHYTHQAHHGPSEGGEANYSRADARHVLTMVASFVAHSRSR